tara:strand:- start:597 stop:1646 length:1050 start_codon:yes stop_codon:yes gene_type:complete
MRSFASDNNSGISESILKAIREANSGHELAYGDDSYSKQLKKCFEELFDQACEPFIVLTGTGANVISLALLTRSFECIFCSQSSHINVDECGAPEKFSGSKLVPVNTVNGKFGPQDLEPHLNSRGFEHHVQPGAVSLTQVTELGTVYSLNELRALSEYCVTERLKIHMDGARFSNAVAALECKPGEIIDAGKVDILSFGGTKNGMMLGEAVVLFDQSLNSTIPYLRKQAMQLASKMRFISAQFLAFFEKDLWLQNARNANQMAKILASRVENMPELRITASVDSNAVFVEIPLELNQWLRDQGYWFYNWNESCDEVRWMTSFDTTEKEVHQFADTIEEGLVKLGKITIL